MQLFLIALLAFAWAWVLLREGDDAPVRHRDVDVDGRAWRALRDRLAVPSEEMIDPEREQAGE